MTTVRVFESNIQLRENGNAPAGGAGALIESTRTILRVNFSNYGAGLEDEEDVEDEKELLVFVV